VQIRRKYVKCSLKSGKKADQKKKGATKRKHQEIETDYKKIMTNRGNNRERGAD
jgi:hypothetical protein